MARPRKKTEEEQPQDAVDETAEAEAPEAEEKPKKAPAKKKAEPKAKAEPKKKAAPRKPKAEEAPAEEPAVEEVRRVQDGPEEEQLGAGGGIVAGEVEAGDHHGGHGRDEQPERPG